MDGLTVPVTDCAAVPADDAGGQDPQLQLLGARVLVAPADETAARRLLAKTEKADPRPEARRQPLPFGRK
jgi:hypothetical protein